MDTMEVEALTAMPSALNAMLVVRVGVPLGRSRGGWKRDINFNVNEGYAVFREKCMVKFTDICTNIPDDKRQIELADDKEIYLKRAKHDSQEKYVQLSPDNFVASLEHRWGLLTARDRVNIGCFRFEVFLYVKNKISTQQFFRATAARIDRARVQRATYEASNAVSFGPITAHHLDIVNARRPDSASFEVPMDNTTQQAIFLDRQLQDKARDVEPDDSARAAIVQIKLNGLWVPVEVDKRSLRRALRLPDHDIFTDGIFHAFEATTPSNAAMEDVDHQDPDGNEMQDG